MSAGIKREQNPQRTGGGRFCRRSKRHGERTTKNEREQDSPHVTSPLPSENSQVPHKFKNKFFAESSKKPRECKREVVSELARAVKGTRCFLPLDSETVEGVAAAMKEVGMKSGSQYLAELKLIHVESGFEIPAWLKRTFDLCKKGLERERGPVKRAASVKVHRKGWPLRPVRSFIWASLWMLREIELRNMKVKHVKLDTIQKKVSVIIPLSKCDQQGEGVKRTLGCCGKRTCEPLCPFNVAKSILSERPKSDMLGLSWLFPSKWNSNATKAGMVESWKQSFGLDISGHSPRRSGAMFYVRLGLPIQELAFLGRWRSNVVLMYAEEALQETAVRIAPAQGDKGPKHAAPIITIDDVENLVTDKLKTEFEKWAPPPSILPPKEDQGMDLASCFAKPRHLWVKTKGRGLKGRPCHLVTRASWTLSVSSWSTACGWFFAEKSRDFSFVPNKPKDMLVCSKCAPMEKSATKSERETSAQLEKLREKMTQADEGQVEGEDGVLQRHIRRIHP